MSTPVHPLSALRQDPGCRDGFLWRCDLLSTAHALALLDALHERGWRTTRRLGASVTLLAPEGDEQLILVTSTGRLQLRLPPTTPHAMRAQRAQDLHQRLLPLLVPQPTRTS